jgi:outer membrane protein OmpA-like peptidoglycan-associated protein
VRRFACVILLAVAACTAPVTSEPQRFIVFFQEWSAAIGPEAEKAITAAAQYAKDHPADAVKVTGYADPTGSAAANVYMSHARAQVVADQLVTDGVDQSRLSVTAEGATAFTLTSQESRRVGIVIGGP